MEAERDEMGSEEDGGIAGGERLGCFLREVTWLVDDAMAIAVARE